MRSLTAPETSFTAEYAKFLAACIGNNYEDNYDWRRFGQEHSSENSVREWCVAPIRNFLSRTGLVRESVVKNLFAKGFGYIGANIGHLDWLYEHLEDSESRECLVQVVAFRALGHRLVKLPMNRPEHWEAIEKMEKSAVGCETLDTGYSGWRLPKLDLRKIGYPIELFFRPVGTVIQFFHEQYRCVTALGVIQAEAGDHVIDAGGCWGDTALYFAVKVGDQGRVASFEFLPDNLKIYRRNLELNPELAGRIRLLEHPVWSSSDQQLFIEGNGPSTTVRPDAKSPDAKAVTTLSIDRVLERGDLARVDFIKMDIEGAELSALHGAEATLRRFRPKLAITVYHSLSDFWQITEYLDSLDLGYKFYLRHFTIHSEETVLFAQSEREDQATAKRPNAGAV